MSHPHRRNAQWKRQLAIASRWLHIYLSMVSFAILLFFAVTGIALNHQDWFGGAARTTQFHGVVKATSATSKDAIVASLRQAHNLKSALSDYRVDDSQISVSFKGPGYAADAFIDRATGKYDLTETRQGLASVLNDLHKGRDTGTVWAAIITPSSSVTAAQM